MLAYLLEKLTQHLARLLARKHEKWVVDTLLARWHVNNADKEALWHADHAGMHGTGFSKLVRRMYESNCSIYYMCMYLFRYHKKCFKYKLR